MIWGGGGVGAGDTRYSQVHQPQYAKGYHAAVRVGVAVASVVRRDSCTYSQRSLALMPHPCT